jgi:hypothetical protein
MQNVRNGGRRLRALAALLTAAASFAAIAGVALAAGHTSQSGTQLAAGGAGITFQGFIQGPVGGNLFGPELGCASGTEPNCEFVTFTAQATGTATLTLNSRTTDTLFGGFELLDFVVDCSGTMRTTGSTDPVTGTATVNFPVTIGETCIVRITSQLGSLSTLNFDGSLTLVAETVTVINGYVTGGGQVLDPNTSFTSNAKPKKTGFDGNVRYFNSSSCRFQSRTITSLVTTETTDAFGNTFKTAVIKGFGRVNVGSGWQDDPVEFHAKAEDHGQTGDRFAIDKCGGVDAPIAHGQIVIHEK